MPPGEPDLSQLTRVFNEQRHLSGQSFDQLARASGLTRGTLMNVASGRSHGDLRTWLILAKVWGKSVDQLMVQVWGGGTEAG